METRANTAWCICIYVSQIASDWVAPTRCIAQSRTNFCSDIMRRLESRDNRLISARVICIHLRLRHKSRRCGKEAVRKVPRDHLAPALHLARFPSSREREKSSFSIPEGIIIHLRETPDRAEKDPRPEFGVASPEIFSPREDCGIGFGVEGWNARRFGETKFRNGFLGN